MCIRNEDPRPYLKRDSELINLMVNGILTLMMKIWVIKRNGF